MKISYPVVHSAKLVNRGRAFYDLDVVTSLQNTEIYKVEKTLLVVVILCVFLSVAHEFHLFFYHACQSSK